MDKIFVENTYAESNTCMNITLDYNICIITPIGIINCLFDYSPYLDFLMWTQCFKLKYSLSDFPLIQILTK